ncbi:MAG: DUF3750 domain-containing protein [Betaproteobacteria bacterium]|nr:DUF3750 domain-containing protein [Betaproteobacteria bacterium]
MRRGGQLSIRDLVTAIVARVAESGSASSPDWRTERRASAGLAPDPATTPEPVVQVYGARCSSWRRYFGVHTWIAVKPSSARAYVVYEVTDARFRRTGSALAIRKRVPDASWYGNAPELLAEKRGDGVDALIARIDKAAREYPYKEKYVVWPGPNSNTFTAHVARAVPELEVDFPPTAIGKDYLGGKLVATAPSGSGLQVSLFGLLGVLASRIEGFEVNVLGLTFGIDSFSPALKLPLVGRLGAARSNGSSAGVRVTAESS